MTVADTKDIRFPTIYRLNGLNWRHRLLSGRYVGLLVVVLKTKAHILTR